MKVITVRNVNDALFHGLPYLLREGVKEDSRNGSVIVAPGPVMTEYTHPMERVVFSPTRDANPFFHLMEALWMLAGRNDLDWPLYFNSRFKEFSNDGKYVHGAYGQRWRVWFGMDQLFVIGNELKNNPKSRRAVLAMWSAGGDLAELTTSEGRKIGGLKSKDVPCNTHIYFDLRYGKLNMTVCNRSNDVIWGAYGANAVHLSMLQEYMAAWIGVPVGVYRQFSNNFHVYLDVYNTDKLQQIAQESYQTNYYAVRGDRSVILVEPSPLVSTNVDEWNSDLLSFLGDPKRHNTYKNSFFNDVARPMYMGWYARKNKEGSGLEEVERIKATDWQRACVEWIARRERKH